MHLKLAYDAMNILAEAIKTAGKIAPRSARRSSLSRLPGVLGTFPSPECDGSVR